MCPVWHPKLPYKNMQSTVSALHAHSTLRNLIPRPLVSLGMKLTATCTFGHPGWLYISHQDVYVSLVPRLFLQHTTQL